LYQGDDAQRLMSQVSMIFGIAPAVAPIVGGWILGWGAWPVIFWFLAGFSMLLLLATALWLPETHPREARLRLAPRRMLRDYTYIFRNPRFQRLAAAASFAFAGLFLYIASAPAFVIDLLQLNERQFAWLFIPTIAGMTLGAFVSGRAAGRLNGERQVGIGFMCIAVAALVNLAYSALAPSISIPWAVMPMALVAFGVALVFPIVTLAILEMYPRHRGAASSAQAFTSLVLNAIVAGVLSPLLSHHALHLALATAVFGLLGWLFWRWEMWVSRSLPACSPDGAALEPTDQL
ncbi:MAG: MFS transporter, partial [Pseudoxanthomonas sp.]|nr:MFS transporter [Pseudoxanthomonas sp.]